MNKKSYLILAISLLGIVLFTSLRTLGDAQMQNNGPPYIYANGRFGFGLSDSAGHAKINDKPAYLNAGWYWDWAARGNTQLPPLRYAQTIRLKPILTGSKQIGYTATPTGTALIAAAQAQPGSIWFVGNEPDCTAMDNMHSEWYARAYHDMYVQIKAADPTAQVGFGSIVQPTKMRLLYLQRVLDTYQAEYGELPPTDLWVTHSYILCEDCYPTPHSGDPFAWGACYVPDWPSQNAGRGITTYYSVYDHWDVNIFASRIITLRQWMADRGYRNQPLLISEYGILFYDALIQGTLHQDPDAVNREFMQQTFDWMRTARDPDIGYPEDDNRLVQRWAWFSLEHGGYPGGSLFNPATNEPEYVGTVYHEYAQQVTPTVELLLLPKEPLFDDPPGATFSVTLQVEVANAGNIATEGQTAVNLYIPMTSSITQPYTTVYAPPLDCCGGHATATVTLHNQSRQDTTYCFNFPGRDPEQGVCGSWNVGLRIAMLNTPILSHSVPVTVPVHARITNEGEINTGEPVTVTFYESRTTSLIPFAVITTPVVTAGGTVTATALWPNLMAGQHPYCVTAKTVTGETAQKCSFAWINPPHRVYLPLIKK